MAQNGTITRRSDGSEIELRALAAADLPAVCWLHFAAFRIQSSRRFLERAYYPTFLTPGSTGFGVVAARAGELAGFCVGTLDDGAYHRALLRRHPFECALALLGKLRRGGRSDPRRAALREARLHYVAIAPAERGSGLGRRLLVETLRYVRDAGCTTCASRIYADNEASRRLNLSLGARLELESRDALGPYAVYRFTLDRPPGEASSG